MGRWRILVSAHKLLFLLLVVKHLDPKASCMKDRNFTSNMTQLLLYYCHPVSIDHIGSVFLIKVPSILDLSSDIYVPGTSKVTLCQFFFHIANFQLIEKCNEKHLTSITTPCQHTGSKEICYLLLAHATSVQHIVTEPLSLPSTEKLNKSQISVSNEY